MSAAIGVDLIVDDWRCGQDRTHFARVAPGFVLAEKCKHRRDGALRCVKTSATNWLYVWLPESERAQQYGADECKHCEYGQHIKPQGKVHGTSPVLGGCD
jgi:hypothetical protein